MRHLFLGVFVAALSSVAACGRSAPPADPNAPSAEDLSRWSAATSDTAWNARPAGPHREDALDTQLDLGGTWVGNEPTSDAPRAAVEGVDESAYVGHVISWLMETVVRHHGAGFRSCRDATPGKALFKLYISSDGTNIRARTVQTTLSAATTKCLLQQWSKVTVPLPAGGPAIALVPIGFNP